MSEQTIRVTLPWKLNYHNEAGELIPYGPGEDDIPVEMAEGLVREDILDESVLEQEPAPVELEAEVVEADTTPAQGEQAPVDTSGMPPAQIGGETMLPQEFPARDLLIGAGFVTVEGVAQAEDETLSDIKGIGPATLEEIREAQEQPEDYS